MTSPLPTYRTALGIAKEAVYGTAVPATGFIAVSSLTPADKVSYLDDVNWRGSAVESYGHVAGPTESTFDFGGSVFADTILWPIAGLLGDVVTTGTATAPTGTLSALSIVGATSLSSSVSIPNGTLIQVDVGNLSETVTTSGVPTGAGPYAIPVPAMTKAHASAVAITAITAPFTTASSVLNSGNTQPKSYTLTDFDAVNARQYPGMRFSEVAFKFDGAALFDYTAKATGLISAVNGAPPTPSFSSVGIQAGWTGAVLIGGSASGVQMVSGEFTVKRPVDPIQAVDGTQPAYYTWAGPVSCDGKMTLVMLADTFYAQFIAGTSTAVDITFSQGSGATATTVTLHCSSAAFTDAVKNFGKSYIELDITFVGDANVTDVGVSGGYSPCRITVKNALTPGTVA